MENEGGCRLENEGGVQIGEWRVGKDKRIGWCRLENEGGCRLENWGWVQIRE